MEGEEGQDKSKCGVVYLSRIPPTMTPHELRTYLEPFGKIGRVFLAPDERTLKSGKLSSKNPKDHRKARFTEGWIEFLCKKDAKTVVLALNGQKIGGKKSNRFYDDIWNLKYLKGFQWSSLSEQAIYERAIRQQKLRTEISQARKINSQYIRQSEKSKELGKIQEKRAIKQAKLENTDVKMKNQTDVMMDQMGALKKRFKQRQPVKIDEE